MTMLAALERAYRWMPDAPKPGFAFAKIGVVVGLNEDGTIATVSSLKEKVGKKEVARSMSVPAPVKRSVNVAPNTFWDKTSYTLGLSKKDDPKDAARHEAFRQHHRNLIGGSNDPGLVAFLRFLDNWSPDHFLDAGFREEMKDENVVFALEGERRKNIFIHGRLAARALLEEVQNSRGEGPLCLVTGEQGPIALTHPSIQGVWGAQSSGASIVSFNAPAYESYGHSQGENAPVSQAAAEAYVGALNRFLANGSGHRMQVGDASVAFWAEAPTDLTDREERQGVERFAESAFAEMLSKSAKEDQAQEDEAETKEVRDVLNLIRRGKPFGNTKANVDGRTRFYVLGLSPNAARISVRFWLETTLGKLADHYRRFSQDIEMDMGRGLQPLPGLRTMAVHTAPAHIDRQGKVKFDTDHLSPLLAGELVRSMLSDARFPGPLLPTLIGRIRTDGVISRVRISLIKAAIVRTMRLEGRLPKDNKGEPREDYLVRSDPDDPNEARRLGRLFALIERAQAASLGDEVNSTVADKYLSSASATPRQVFPGIVLNSENHTRRLRKGRSDAEWIRATDNPSETAKRVGGSLHRDIGRLFSGFQNGLPVQHSSEEQGLFLVGYYQERFGKKRSDDVVPGEPDLDPDTPDDQESH